MGEEIECIKCFWQGFVDELLCSDEDNADLTKPTSSTIFNICPDCGEADCFENIEEDF